ncbi:MAG: serine/threonine-protein kinase [Actinomycetota bacterium]|nr:serine/threonine-protein kinase [Actinomycetota bacterium]
MTVLPPPDPVLASVERALPGYDVFTELGRGAYGVVLAGRHRQLGRDVAIKQLTVGQANSEAVRARFRAEAQVLASIAHPHVVPIYDYVEREDVCLLVMERLNGGTLWRRFVDQGFTQPTSCAVALVACSGLHGAHRLGVLHRDMKPENMLFGADGSLKVADFGIAKVLSADDTLATPEGELLGTPAYMAPEQASGADIGPATDVYAAGVMLYEMLSGQLPYPEDGGALAIVLRHLNEPPTPLSEVAPAVPVGLAAVVMRALARSPEERFATAEEFGVAIASAAAGEWGSRWLDGLTVGLREPGPILDSARHGGPGARPSADATTVRPAVDLHQAGAPAGVVLDDLMPLRRAPVAVPPFPRRLTWAAVALAVVTVALGLLGVGSSSPSPALARGAVLVAGKDPAEGAVSLDLDRTIRVLVHGVPARTGVPMSASLDLSLGGVVLVHSTTSGFTRSATGFAATLDASAGRYVVGGALDASLAIAGPRGTVRDDFAVRAARSPFGTLLGAASIVLLLVVAAYAESLLRGLRRGRRRESREATVGTTVVGALSGVVVSLWGWMAGVSVPAFPGLLVPVALGAAAGLVAALAARRVGDRARARRQANRLVLVAKRRPAPPAPPAPDPEPIGAAR